MITRMLQSFSIVMAFALAACASTPAKERTVEPGRTDIAALPFSADQIRKAMKVGTEITQREEDGRGKVQLVEWTVTEATADEVTLHTKILSEDFKVVEDKGTAVHKWTELRDHAAFPVDQTVRSEGMLTVPVGVHETWLYVVSSTNEEGKSVESYYQFAKTLPGPPVQMSVIVDGQLVRKVTMVGRR